MTGHDAFLREIQAHPAKAAVRMQYADWLEDQGDPRGEYLRVDDRLAAGKVAADEVPALHGRLMELRSVIEPGWLAVFDQPRIMRANPTPFPAGWWGGELPGYRSAASTYKLYPYNSLPPLPIEQFRGDFGWLRRARKSAESSPASSRPLTRLTDEAAALGLTVPPEFGRFLADAALPKRIRSCTDCYFDRPARIAPSPAGCGGSLLRFYSDSQGCLHWYLYLTKQGYHCVVVSGGYYGGSEGEPEAAEPRYTRPKKCWFCAPTFEAFLYRMWIENEIWYALSVDHDPLTDAEQVYLGHYKRK